MATLINFSRNFPLLEIGKIVPQIPYICQQSNLCQKSYICQQSNIQWTSTFLHFRWFLWPLRSSEKQMPKWNLTWKTCTWGHTWGRYRREGLGIRGKSLLPTAEADTCERWAGRKEDCVGGASSWLRSWESPGQVEPRANTAYPSRHRAGMTRPSSLIGSAIHLQQPGEPGLGMKRATEKRCRQLEAVWQLPSLQQFLLKEDLSSALPWLLPLLRLVATLNCFWIKVGIHLSIHTYSYKLPFWINKWCGSTLLIGFRWRLDLFTEGN